MNLNKNSQTKLVKRIDKGLMMNDSLELYIKNIENHFNNVIGWTPKEFSKLKNQLSCQDYAMAEKKMDKIEFELFFHSAYGDEIKNLLNSLKSKIVELKLEKEQKKLNEKLQNE